MIIFKENLIFIIISNFLSLNQIYSSDCNVISAFLKKYNKSEIRIDLRKKENIEKIHNAIIKKGFEYLNEKINLAKIERINNHFQIKFKLDQVIQYSQDYHFFGFSENNFFTEFKIDYPTIKFPKKIKSLEDLEIFLNSKLSNDFKITFVEEENILNEKFLEYLLMKKIPISTSNNFSHDLLVHFMGYKSLSQLSIKKIEEFRIFLSILLQLKNEMFLNLNTNILNLKSVDEFIKDQVRYLDRKTASNLLTEKDNLKLNFPLEKSKFMTINFLEFNFSLFNIFEINKVENSIENLYKLIKFLNSKCNNCSNDQLMIILNYFNENPLKNKLENLEDFGTVFLSKLKEFEIYENFNKL